MNLPISSWVPSVVPAQSYVAAILIAFTHTELLYWCLWDRTFASMPMEQAIQGNIIMTSSNGNIFRVTGPLCGDFTGPGNSPHKGQWRGSLMFSLICVWINGWVNNREAGDLRRHRGHYDVIKMWVENVMNPERNADMMTTAQSTTMRCTWKVHSVRYN